MVTGMLHHAQWAIFARRLSRGMSSLLDDAERLFLAHDRAFQFGARFLPKLNPVAAAFAGVAGVSVRRFFLGGAASAAVWAGTWIGVGYLGASVTSSRGSGLPLVGLIVTASAIALLGAIAYVARGRQAAAALLRPHTIIQTLAKSPGRDRWRKGVGMTTSVNGHDGGEGRDSAGGCGELERGRADGSVARRSAFLPCACDRDGHRGDDDDRALVS
jgi:hypothetical protein